jgi:hypothetical protein
MFYLLKDMNLGIVYFAILEVAFNGKYSVKLFFNPYCFIFYFSDNRGFPYPK